MQLDSGQIIIMHTLDLLAVVGKIRTIPQMVVEW